MWANLKLFFRRKKIICRESTLIWKFRPIFPQPVALFGISLCILIQKKEPPMRTAEKFYVLFFLVAKAICLQLKTNRFAYTSCNKVFIPFCFFLPVGGILEERNRPRAKLTCANFSKKKNHEKFFDDQKLWHAKNCQSLGGSWNKWQFSVVEVLFIFFFS